MKYFNREILTQACQELFETMFFSFIEPVDPQAEGLFVPKGDILHGKISLNASCGEVLHFVAPKIVMRNLASILFHNRPEEVSKAELLDLTQEITNIILGKALQKSGTEQTQRFAALSTENMHSMEDLNLGPECDPVYLQTDWGIIAVILESAYARQTT